GAAQEPPAGALSLTDALVVARRESPALAESHAALATAAADRLQRLGALLPSVDASISWSTAHSRSFTATDVFGDPTAREVAVESTTRGATQSLGLGVTLFDGGESWSGVRAATERRRAADAATRRAWIDVRAAVATAYFALMESREALGLERALLEARRADVERTEGLFRVAAADAIDLLGVRIEASRQEAGVSAAVEEAEKAGIDLGRSMGTGGAIESALAAPLEPFDPDSLDLDALVAAALEAHPELARATAEFRAARAEADAEGWLAYLPTVHGSAGWGRSEFGGSEQEFFHLDPRNSSWNFRLTLSLPVFDGFARQAGRARATAAVNAAEERLEAALLDAEAEVRRRFLDLRNAWRQLELERTTVEMARERAEMARERHRIGAIDFVRLQEVLDQATEAERARVLRHYGWYRALVELERAAGRAVALPDVP
ncbi:MAG TPA: TolC family protein, partial [Gemmatimonadota bacterium]|nr:TolC family protein [Gemmatimonadota bacterium]